MTGRERTDKEGGKGGNFLCMEQTIPKGESPKATKEENCIITCL